MTQYSLAIYDKYLSARWDEMDKNGTLPEINRIDLSARLTTMSRSLDSNVAETFGIIVGAIMLHFKYISDKTMPPPLVYGIKSMNKGVGLTGAMDKMPDKLIQILTIFLNDYNAVPTLIPDEFMLSD